MTARAESIIGISATRASAILGMNKWKSPVLAWQEIMEKIYPPQFDDKGVCTYNGFNAEKGFILPPKEDKAVFRWGSAFEESVIELAMNSADDKIGMRENLYSDPGEPTAFCYVDGVYAKSLALCEAKTTFERAYRMSWGEPGTDRIPDHVQIQVQHQMMCSGADQCIVSVLVLPFSVDDLEKDGLFPFSGDSITKNIENPSEGGSVIGSVKEWAHVLAQMGFFHQYPIESKPDSIHKPLREAYDHFWQKYVITETPPELDDYEDIRRMFPAPVGTLVVSDLVASQCREYKSIGAEIGSGGFLKKKQVQLKTDILKLCLTETTVADDESQERIILRDQSGNKVGSFDGKTFRA